LMRWITGAVLIGASTSALIFMRTYRALPDPEPESKLLTASKGVIPSLSPVTGAVWIAMVGRPDGHLATGQTRPTEPFRLAGTFSIENGSGEPFRKAILDDILKRQQYIVGEGERIDDSTVTKVYYDHVTIQSGGGSREVWLDFASRGLAASGAGDSNQVAVAGGAGTNRFGCVLISDNRWQFSRKPLMDYYQELLDEPERMVAVFDTMKPVRDERNKITGYVVGIEGEKDFFEAVGLRQGDIVRSVNSIPMTNRKRAEFLIDEFIKDNMSAVVMDVERGGQPVKQVYQLRH
jgi:type II secretory pathway component PulC